MGRGMKMGGMRLGKDGGKVYGGRGESGGSFATANAAAPAVAVAAATVPATCTPSPLLCCRCIAVGVAAVAAAAVRTPILILTGSLAPSFDRRCSPACTCRRMYTLALTPLLAPPFTHRCSAVTVAVAVAATLIRPVVLCGKKTTTINTMINTGY